MAEINKVELNLSHKIANPFKTTRKSDTNPFKYSNFEGNTLQFADVFEGFESKNVSFKGNKLKLITSSVMGSMTKLRNSITEPIIKFVKRIGEDLTTAWNNSSLANINLDGLKNLGKNISDIMNYDVGKGLSTLGKNIISKTPDIHLDVTELGKGLATKWADLIGKIHHNKITKETTVAELRTMWETEIALSNALKEVA